MAYVVNFRRFRPSARAVGALLWTQASIQEASYDPVTGEPGAFTQIELKNIAALYPGYTLPASPPYMDFTTELGSLRPGYYRIVFRDATAAEEYTAPLLYGVEGTRPSTAAVAGFIKNRTVDTHNNYLGDFTADTVLTADEVEGVISTAQDFVLRALDQDPNVALPTESQAAIKDLVALLAAALVELSKFSEQVARGVSPYPQLKALFDEQLAIVQADLGITPSAGGSSGAALSVWDLIQSEYGYALYAFPDPDMAGMVGWVTRF